MAMPVMLLSLVSQYVAGDPNADPSGMVPSARRPPPDACLVGLRGPSLTEYLAGDPNADPSGMTNGPRRIIDPDARQIRSKDPAGEVSEQELEGKGDKAFEAANNAQVGALEE
ncbi:hypothetical protein T484DRAFT_1772828, partial [Baffinella frigidus]